MDINCNLLKVRICIGDGLCDKANMKTFENVSLWLKINDISFSNPHDIFRSTFFDLKGMDLFLENCQMNITIFSNYFNRLTPRKEFPWGSRDLFEYVMTRNPRMQPAANR